LAWLWVCEYEKTRKLPQVHCHPLSSMRVRIELLTWDRSNCWSILQLPNSVGMEPDMLLADKKRSWRYFRRPISGPIDPETSDDDRSIEITLLLSLQATRCMYKEWHQKCSSWILWNLAVRTRLLDRSRRARPSELKPQDDETKMQKSKTQWQGTSFILSLKMLHSQMGITYTYSCHGPTHTTLVSFTIKKQHSSTIWRSGSTFSH